MAQHKPFDIESFLNEYKIDNKVSNNDWLSVSRCPFCQRRGKSGVNPQRTWFRCFSPKCDGSGSLVKFVSHVAGITTKEAAVLIFGNESSAEYLKRLQSKDSESDHTSFVLNMLGGKVDKHQPERRRESHLGIVLPKSIRKIDLDEDREAVEYLAGRGVTEEMIETLDIRHWDDGDGRVVFPVTTCGILEGYVGRDYTGESDKKVKNSTGDFKSASVSAVWNYDNVVDSDELIICEGIFSAIKCGIDRSVALLGKTATASQIDLLAELGPKTVYVCLDVDAIEDAEKLAAKLSTRFSDVRIVRLPENTDEAGGFLDAGDYTEDEMDGYISETMPTSKGMADGGLSALSILGKLIR
jgi:DNA primase